ncbi:MAG: hypothetical protein SH850_16045 [Planctomycetaceae bacterium]|nr:hypothetical protein [Planctomycetaceae bacterium]
MNSRAFAALLRLLPLSSSQSTDNPLQVQRLPDYSRTEFDYPVYQDTPAAARRSTAILIFLVALTAPALSWANSLSSYPAQFIHGGLSTVVLMAGTALVILGTVGLRWPLMAYGLAVLSVPIVGELVIEQPFALAAAFPAAIGTWILADRLGLFFLFLKTAAPLSRERSVMARALWHRRWTSPFRPLRGTEWYPLNYLLFAVPLCLALLQERGVWQGDTEARRILELCGLLAIAGCIWPLVLEIVIAPLYGRRPYGLVRLVRAFWHALLEWCTYNRHNARGAGIHHSPAGPCVMRRWLLIGVLLVGACAWNNPHTVEPLFNRIFGNMLEIGGVWLPAVRKIDPEEIVSNIERNQEAEMAASIPPLTDDEQHVLERMPAGRAEAYQAERERQYLAVWKQKQSQASSRVATKDSANRLQHLLKGLGKVVLNVLAPSLGTALVCLSLVFGASARALAGVEDLFGSGPRQRVLNSENWERLVDRLQSSQDYWESQSLFLGTNWRDDTPALVPREIFAEHAHILGDSGSGKTSIGLMPLVCQLMRSGKCSVVVLDLKADDQALLESLREESANLSERRRVANPPEPPYPFRWFTSELGRSSYIFNPLSQRATAQLADYQRTDLLVSALGLHYGTDYGRKFYGDANYDILNHALAKYPDVQSFVELAEILARKSEFPMDAETKRAASNVRSSVRRMARCQPLNACRSLGTSATALEQAIDFSEVFRQPQAVYFALPPSSGITITAEIARLALHSLLTAAQTHEGRRTPVFLVVDEFQRIVSNNLALFLQMARSMDIGVILSNQSLDDLETAGVDLIAAVRTNTRFRQVFAAGNRSDILDIRDTAGESVIGLRSWDLLPGLFSDGAVDKMSIRETPVSRLMLNDILLATDAFGRNIVSVRRGAGYAQFGGMPFIMDSVHHIAFDEFKRRRETPWPAAHAGTIVGTHEEQSPIVAGGGSILEDEPDADDGAGNSPPDDPDADSAAGILEDPLEALLAEQEATRAKRRKQQRQDQQERFNRPSAGDLFP